MYLVDFLEFFSSIHQHHRPRFLFSMFVISMIFIFRYMITTYFEVIIVLFFFLLKSSELQYL